MLGFPRLGAFPRRYLIVGSALFVSYEICLSLSLGFAADRAQAIELGIVNYLWPCLTVVFAMLINGQRASAWVVPASRCRCAGSPGWWAARPACRGSAASPTLPATQ